MKKEMNPKRKSFDALIATVCISFALLFLRSCETGRIVNIYFSDVVIFLLVLFLFCSVYQLQDENNLWDHCYFQMYLLLEHICVELLKYDKDNIIRHTLNNRQNHFSTCNMVNISIDQILKAMAKKTVSEREGEKDA